MQVTVPMSSMLIEGLSHCSVSAYKGGRLVALGTHPFCAPHPPCRQSATISSKNVSAQAS